MNGMPRQVSAPYQENVSIYTGPPRDVTAPTRFAAALPLVLEGRPAALLDVGCGRGDFLRRIPPAVKRCGIDGLPAAEVLPDIEYCRQDIALGLPWPEATFDAVFAGEVIEHQLDTAAFLAECRRVLRPGGILVLTTPNLAYWRNLLQWLRRQQFFFVDHRMGENGHVRYFAPRTLEALLGETGFVVERLFSVGDLPTSTNALLRGIGRAAGRWCPLRNLSLIAKARRARGAPAPAGTPPGGRGGKRA
jgi:SAM-dependent methyltransferase